MTDTARNDVWAQGTAHEHDARAWAVRRVS